MCATCHDPHGSEFRAKDFGATVVPCAPTQQAREETTARLLAESDVTSISLPRDADRLVRTASVAAAWVGAYLVRLGHPVASRPEGESPS